MHVLGINTGRLPLSLRFAALTEGQKQRCYFFGSFNPVTGQGYPGASEDVAGHVNLAVRAQKQLGFKEMVFVPVFAAPHKDQSQFATFKHRVEMLWRSFQGRSGLVVSEVEKHLPPPSFTVQTLRALVPGFDQLKEKVPFLIGADALKGLNTWREGRLLADKLVFIAAPRDGEAPPTELVFNGEKVPLSVELVQGVNSSVSATLVRDKVAQGQSIKGLVAPDVETYIHQNRLYTKQALWDQLRSWVGAQAQKLAVMLGYPPVT